MDKKFFVQQLKKFSDLYQINVDEEILGEIVNKATFRVLPKGEIIASIGENTLLAGLVLSGLARCYYIDNDGNDITRGFAPEGTMCMDEGFFGYPERICMWETLEETTLMLCRTEDIKNLIKENVEFKDIWITLLERALRYKIYRENGFLVENASERYIHFKKMYPNLSEKVPQKHIATYLGIAPESLSRIRRAMKEND
ncbi:MAG: Crp/Fnr family transcriptional regulator [Lachnospiraceae bacterium]|nr:Crp/Fnr family transcriptional regulator [Lachnospiraceae bacterium]